LERKLIGEKMKIVMTLSNPFKPDPRVYKEARSLIKHGHDVTIIAWDREGKYPTEENFEGIKIKRIKLRSKYGNFSDFALKLPLFYLKALKILLKENFDAIHTHDFDTAFLGFLIKKLKRKRWIYDIHDLYESLVERENKLASKIISHLDSWIIKRSDNIIVVNKRFIKILRERGRKEKIIVVMNTISPIKLPIKKNREFTIFYAGVLSEGRFIIEMIDIAKKLGIKIKIAGSGKLLEEVKKRCYDKCRFLGYVSHDNSLKELSRSHVTFAIYDPSTKNNQLASPNKLFEAMALKTPLLVTEGSVMEEIVKRGKCGLGVKYSKNDAKQKLLYLINNPKYIKKMGHNGKKVFLAKYTWEKMENRLLRLYEGLK